MDDITEKWLKKRIDIILEEIKYSGLFNLEKIVDNFKFETRRKTHSKECEFFYEKGEFCHDGNNEERYCLLCSCNNYDIKTEEGGCKMNNPFGEGYFLDRSLAGLEKIWDCSNCFYPHTRKATISFLRNVRKRVEKGEDLKDILKNIFLGDKKV